MIPHFHFVQPASLAEALRILDETERVTVLAGGTDVVAGMQQGDERFTSAEVVLDIHRLPDLRRIVETDSELHVGGAVTFSEIVSSRQIQSDFPILSQAAASIGSVQIRNRATIAGNFVNNAACADSVPPLLVYDAKVRLQSMSSTRELPLSEFLLRPNRTALDPKELVISIILPKLPAGYQSGFRKLGRRRGIAISRITLAVLLRSEHQRVADLRLASGAVTPIGTRFRRLEDQARGQSVGTELWSSLASSLGEAVIETTGLRWSSPYKLPVVQQMCFGLLSDLSAGASA